MAKSRRQQNAPGLFAVGEMEPDEYAARCAREAELRKDLEWLRKMRDMIAKRWPDGFPDTDDPHEWCMVKIHEFSTALLDDYEGKRPYPEIVRLAWHLGMLYQQLVAQKEFDGLVSKGRVSTKVSSEKAKKRAEKNLSATEERKVLRYIERNRTKPSVTQACKDAAKQLNTGVFPGINRRVPLTYFALQKRWDKRPRALGIAGQF